MSCFSFFFPAPFPTSNCGMQKRKLGQNTCPLRTRIFFARLGADSHAQWVLSNEKFLASELRRKFVKGALLVGMVQLAVESTLIFFSSGHPSIKLWQGGRHALLKVKPKVGLSASLSFPKKKLRTFFVCFEREILQRRSKKKKRWNKSFFLTLKVDRSKNATSCCSCCSCCQILKFKFEVLSWLPILRWPTISDGKPCLHVAGVLSLFSLSLSLFLLVVLTRWVQSCFKTSAGGVPTQPISLAWNLVMGCSKGFLFFPIPTAAPAY